MASLGDIHEANLSANSDLNSKVTGTATTLQGLDSGSSLSHLAGHIFGPNQSADVSVSAGFWGPNINVEAYDFVGIADQNGVEEMKTAVNKYCESVNAEIDKLVTTADPTGTFAGQYTETINEFLAAIKKSCLSTVNALKGFSKDLDQVYAQMQAHDAAVGDSTASDAQSISNAANTESF